MLRGFVLFNGTICILLRNTETTAASIATVSQVSLNVKILYCYHNQITAEEVNFVLTLYAPNFNRN